MLCHTFQSTTYRLSPREGASQGVSQIFQNIRSRNSYFQMQETAPVAVLPAVQSSAVVSVAGLAYSFDYQRGQP